MLCYLVDSEANRLHIKKTYRVYTSVDSQSGQELFPHEIVHLIQLI